MRACMYVYVRVHMHMHMYTLFISYRLTLARQDAPRTALSYRLSSRNGDNVQVQCAISVSARPSGDLIWVNTLARSAALRIHKFAHKSAAVAYFPIRCWPYAR